MAKVTKSYRPLSRFWTRGISGSIISFLNSASKTRVKDRKASKTEATPSLRARCRKQNSNRHQRANKRERQPKDLHFRRLKPRNPIRCIRRVSVVLGPKLQAPSTSRSHWAIRKSYLRPQILPACRSSRVREALDLITTAVVRWNLVTIRLRSSSPHLSKPSTSEEIFPWALEIHKPRRTWNQFSRWAILIILKQSRFSQRSYWHIRKEYHEGRRKLPNKSWRS